MAFFKAIGVFINECGLSHMMIESNIIASGSVNGLVEGKHFNHCKPLHPLMALGLQMLHFDHFLKMGNIEYNFLKEQVINDLLHYQVIDSHSSMPIELPNNVLSRILSAYQKFVEETRHGEHGKTAKFYLIYIQLVNYYIILSRSIRMGDFEMFKYVIPKITNLFFAVNQPNYARWCVKYLDNLNKVDETHPGLKNDFMNGCFGIKRTDKPFSRIPIDLTLEQTINAEAARRLSGIAHFTNSIAACQCWTKSHSIRAAIISHLLDVFRLKQLQDVSADLQPNRIKIYGKQIADFIEIFEKNINPFDENLDKDSLYNIATAKPVLENVANFLLNIEKNGEDLRKHFITECTEDQDRFDKPTKKNQVLNFAGAPKKKKLTLGNKVIELRMQRDLFSRLLGISMTNKVDIEKVLGFPLTPIPTSMCQADGSICKTDKAQLIEVFEKKVSKVNQQSLFFDISILYDKHCCSSCCTLLDSDILIILLGNLDHLNASLKFWIQWGVGNHERLISINDLYQDLGISLSKVLPCFHAITGCDYTPVFFRKGKLRPFKLLEKSVEYQLACQEIVTDDEDELERTFATLEKLICHMYGVPNSSNVNDVRFYLFSKT
ncbi:uncharacterized protein TNIN_444071 [Trichonephila inaurata madagascariensis]|uniref:Uncharacterized protein n=1 Tax=Trichonephila inaurata madagascariensis TaxID=2747483 RepID=A0A8X6XQZ7_9ARAC|nr:uncharacterized protein TNIN_444071 [Trichonephila inaurata madagascariensis]